MHLGKFLLASAPCVCRAMALLGSSGRFLTSSKLQKTLGPFVQTSKRPSGWRDKRPNIKFLLCFTLQDCHRPQQPCFFYLPFFLRAPEPPPPPRGGPQEAYKRPPRDQAPKRPPRGPQAAPKRPPRGPQEASKRPPRRPMCVFYCDLQVKTGLMSKKTNVFQWF